METVVNGIPNVIVYIDDLLVHSATHKEHLATLGQVSKRLVQHKIKLNLQKCIFGCKEVSYLGFTSLKKPSNQAQTRKSSEKCPTAFQCS
jgi:hypothetical protein